MKATMKWVLKHWIRMIIIIFVLDIVTRICYEIAAAKWYIDYAWYPIEISQYTLKKFPQLYTACDRKYEDLYISNIYYRNDWNWRIVTFADGKGYKLSNIEPDMFNFLLDTLWWCDSLEDEKNDNE